MAFDRYLIAPMNSGLQTDLKPWLIMDDAFVGLTNAYTFRGRVRKRFGSYYTGSGATTTVQQQLLSRASINVGTTTSMPSVGSLSGTVPGGIGHIGQAFSVTGIISSVTTTVLFTVISSTAGAQPMLRSDSSSATATFDVSNGNFVIQGSLVPDGTVVYWYPSNPIMGLTQYARGEINNFPAYAFDTQFAYLYSGGQWTRSGSSSSLIFHGSNAQFFWATNWRGATNTPAMFVTNFNASVPIPNTTTDDPMWYTADGVSWTSFSPRYAPVTGPTTGPFVKTSRIIIAFKNRLLLLNTIENDGSNSNSGNGATTQYVNRCRFSHNGDPTTPNAFYEPSTQDNVGGIGDGGGFIDATTQEAIVSAEFIKDRLIIYFERSTWELAATGNNILPFVWQKINTELGSEATFSTVPFDKEVLSIGNTGVHACNGANVVRIDHLIPEKVFDIQDKKTGVARIAGIRDYLVEMVYWTFPSDNNINTYCNKVLTYNYQNKSWAFNNDCITTFGYFEQQNSMTWQSSAPITWEQAEFEWNSGVIEAQFRQVIAGNQQGYIFLVSADIARNAAVMQITNLTVSSGIVTAVIIDHTLTTDDYISLENLGLTGTFNTIYKVSSVVDSNTITVAANDISMALTNGQVYLGGGTSARVSNISIQTKQWNPYVGDGNNVYISKIEFCVDKTAVGQITVDYSPSSAVNLSMISDGNSTQAILGTGILETSAYSADYAPLEKFQDRLWHAMYFQSQGECIQLNMYYSADQITNPRIAWSDFELNGLVLHSKRMSSRLS
ncbi:MAG TPA: hypothetical protein VNZ45_02610 [Bacteroidia bacterium]|jgi:hypothetical protein|nr:hypothetical protein [Bacteroidia bacterium]